MAGARFDLLCIGGGTAGMSAARAARGRGRSVAIVEREPGLGGDCTFWGCVPSKALIEVARVAHRARALAGLGFAEPALDFARVMERQREIVAAIAHDERADVFRREGIEVLPGPASFDAPGWVRVGERSVEAARIVIATGTDPAVPPIPGLAETPHLTNRTIFALRERPRRLLVLGGGPIGLELGQAFRRLGSDVAVIELLETLLPGEEAEAGACVAEALAAEGIELHLGARAEAVARRGAEVAVTVSRDGQRRELVGDALLVATGRAPLTDGLGLDAAGVATDAAGFVTVDQRMRTSADGVYAAGDVTGGLLFTHVAAHEGRVAGVNAAGGRVRVDRRVVPWITFTDPEVARVGLTEAQARAAHGDAVDVARFPMRLVDRARITGEERGFIKLVTLRRGPLARATGGRLLGAHVVGAGAGEVLHEAVVAMRTRSFAGRLAQAIHAYPSMSIGMQQTAAQLFPEGRRLTPAD